MFEVNFNEKIDNWGATKIAEYSHVMDPKNNFLHEKHQLVVCCKVCLSNFSVKIKLRFCLHLGHRQL